MPSQKRVISSDGFILSVDAFRAIIHEMQSSMLLNDKVRHTLFVGHLTDGRLIKFTDVDHVINYDNSGLSSIEELYVVSTSVESFLEGFSPLRISTSIGYSRNNEDVIYISFKKPILFTYHDDMELFVSSENDEFSFFVGQRLEKRLDSIACPKIVKLIHNSYFRMISCTIVFFSIMLAYMALVAPPNVNNATSLRAMYEEGRFKDAIDFLLFQQETNNVPVRVYSILLLIAVCIIGSTLAYLLIRFLRFLFPIYVFA